MSEVKASVAMIEGPLHSGINRLLQIGELRQMHQVIAVCHPSRGLKVHCHCSMPLVAAHPDNAPGSRLWGTSLKLPHSGMSLLVVNFFCRDPVVRSRWSRMITNRSDGQWYSHHPETMRLPLVHVALCIRSVRGLNIISAKFVILFSRFSGIWRQFRPSLVLSAYQTVRS